MADVEEPQYSTLAERIAALNKQKNFQAPPTTATKRPPPPPPPNKHATLARPPAPGSADSNGLPRSATMPPRPATKAAPPALPRRSTAATEDEPAATPPLPSRRPSQQPSPALPPRRPSLQPAPPLPGRRNSNESDRSFMSTTSAFSLNRKSSSTSIASADVAPRRMAPAFDQAKLPPLPPTRRELEAKAMEAGVKEATAQIKAPLLKSNSTPVVPRAIEPPPRPTLPPRLPSRPVKSATSVLTQVSETPEPPLPARRLPPPPSSYSRPKSALENGFGSKKRPDDDVPPPIPMASRPTAAQIELAVRPAAAPVSAPATVRDDCMICRDFSGPDGVAARYPTASLPRQDTIGYLARVLCDPFPSHTDKARAIFVWCHHNIAYDIVGFFGKCIPRGLTSTETIFSGKAVCSGYADIFCDIATRAGMECAVVSGHGKGYGINPVLPGDPVPKEDTNHAWNCVRIDAGEWKLIDSCWGAGITAPDKYTPKLDASQFTMTNDEFGKKHWPTDRSRFYRSDGRVLSWEEYVVEPTREEKATLYTNAAEEGICEKTLLPQFKKIRVHGGDVIRFQFGKFCEHWTYEKHGGGRIPYLMMMAIHGVDGRKDDHVCMEYDGFWWWVDIPARDLGAPGQTISCYALQTLDNKEARGTTAKHFYSRKGRAAMSWTGIAQWELV